MPMPKTAMYKNDFISTGENKIWISRQVPPMQTKAEAHAMHKLPHDQLRFGVAGTNPGHPLATLIGDKLSHDSGWPVHEILGICPPDTSIRRVVSTSYQQPLVVPQLPHL